MVVIKELFFESRFPSGWKMIPLLIYMPFGLILAIIRFFIGIQAIIAASLLHTLSSFRSIVLRTMCAILGVFVFQENEEMRDKSIKIIVTNHVSVFDHLAIHLITGSTSTSLSELPSILHFAFNYKNMGNVKDKENLIQNVKRSVENNITVDIQPENAITSGQKGLLRLAIKAIGLMFLASSETVDLCNEFLPVINEFSKWPCDLSLPIQPACIKLWRPPLMDVKPSVISASWTSDVFWFLFVPFTIFTVKYLPIIEPLDNETAEDMSKRVEVGIAKAMNIVPTSFTSSDKLELEKRLDIERSGSKLSSTKADGKIMEMASKVKEVLPDVPMKTISAELIKTRNVDVTISNFLEGLVRYVPEQPACGKAKESNVPEKKKSLLEVSQPSTSLNVSAKTFPKSARDRMISFQERKMRLIESARQRYIQKHLTL